MALGAQTLSPSYWAVLVLPLFTGRGFEQHCGGAAGAGGAGGGLCSRQLSSVHLTPFLTSFPSSRSKLCVLPHYPVFQPAGEQLHATRVMYTFLGIVLIYICYAC